MAILWSVASGDQESRLVELRSPLPVNFDRERDVRRLKASQHLQQGDDVAAVRAQPARLPQCEAIHRRIQASSRDAGIERGARSLAFRLVQTAQLRLHDAWAEFFRGPRRALVLRSLGWKLWQVAARAVRHEVQRFQRFALPGARRIVLRLVKLLNRAQINR